MQEIAELQRRLSGALDRIGSGLERLGPVADATAANAEPAVDPAVLQAELDAERDLTRQLQERLTAADDRQEARDAELRTEVAQARALAAEMEADRGRLRAVADTLRETCERLREVNAEGVGDADLINQALEEELEALKAMRESDRAELDALLSLLPASDAGQEVETDAR